jgi:sugar lactone lactonase YvrE|tara:strand:- start:1938 stop:2822 length:885 start_codon:yes stop_codon:yes gene_type:complete
MDNTPETAQAQQFDDRPCALGEGPLWHPLREQFFWFDILGKKLCSRDGNGPRAWQFDAYVSAAGWVDSSRLLIASQSQLFLFDVDSGKQEPVVQLEADNRITRSNDGRADPWGGFWIGTMGINSEAAAGTIYRYYRGEVRTLFPDITIANAICFSPDRRFAYFTDTPTRMIRRQPLAAETGWPEGPATDWLDLSAERINPDGAVVDAKGNLWNAQWGAGRVACYSPAGRFLSALALPAGQVTCPAFGGKSGRDLLVTTAHVGLSEQARRSEPQAGTSFLFPDIAAGQLEHRVLL